ncbi:MAG TPA: hypothetical protein VF159_01040, partial [Gemmatimonadaceae bacterium]
MYDITRSGIPPVATTGAGAEGVGFVGIVARGDDAQAASARRRKVGTKVRRCMLNSIGLGAWNKLKRERRERREHFKEASG